MMYRVILTEARLCQKKDVIVKSVRTKGRGNWALKSVIVIGDEVDKINGVGERGNKIFDWLEESSPEFKLYMYNDHTNKIWKYTFEFRTEELAVWFKLVWG